MFVLYTPYIPTGFTALAVNKPRPSDDRPWLIFLRAFSGPEKSEQHMSEIRVEVNHTQYTYTMFIHNFSNESRTNLARNGTRNHAGLNGAV